jgi:hypothetical protein
MVTPFLFSASQKIKISAYADKDKANHIFSGRMKGGDMKIIRSRIVNLRESLLAKSFQLLAKSRFGGKTAGFRIDIFLRSKKL